MTYVIVLTEEAVNEVKRQAVLELQKAVAAAEQKANELVTAERAKMERTLGDAQKQAQDEILSMMNTQEESSEVRSKDSYIWVSKLATRHLLCLNTSFVFTNYQPRQFNAPYNRAFIVDWSLSGIMTLKLVIHESESPQPASLSIMISRMSSSVIIPYITCGHFYLINRYNVDSN